MNDETVNAAQLFVLTPIDRVDAAGKPDLSSPVQLEKARDYLRQLRSRPDRNPLLFTNVPDSTVDLPQKK